MPDIEKIKKGLEACGSDNWNLDKGCDTCPYSGFSPHHDYDFDFGCIKVLARDTLELLEKQQDIVRCKDCKWYDERISLCDNCGLPREQTFFCADGKRADT